MLEINLYEKEVKENYFILEKFISNGIDSGLSNQELRDKLRFIHNRFNDALEAATLFAEKYDELANQIINGNELTSTGSINIQTGEPQ